MADGDKDGMTRNEGVGGTVTNDEVERREVARTGEAGTGPATGDERAGRPEESSSLLEMWDRATGVGRQFRSQRAAEDALKERGKE